MSDLAARRRVPSILDLREIEPGPGADDELVFGLVRRFAREFGDSLVLYGGITATERIYGLKRIREITTDLDFACVPGREESLLSIPGIRYHPAFDILCASVGGLPVTFACGHIHDWPTSPEFYGTARAVPVGGQRVLCASREHSIMLKFRRMAERARRGAPLFGKDALDIINIVAASCRKPGIWSMDLARTARLILSDACADGTLLAGLFRFIAGYTGHLTEAERDAFSPSLAELALALGLDGAPDAGRPRPAEPRGG